MLILGGWARRGQRISTVHSSGIPCSITAHGISKKIPWRTSCCEPAYQIANTPVSCFIKIMAISFSEEDSKAKYLKYHNSAKALKVTLVT
ncbi:13718_t:CDS:2 [Gigaspora rosea]|nr:13718_t:CDS:2 [Gigaspora rosea]